MKKINDYLVVDEKLIGSDIISGVYTDSETKFDADPNVITGIILNGMRMNINDFTINIRDTHHGSIMISIKDNADIYYTNFIVGKGYQSPIYIEQVKMDIGIYIAIETEEYRAKGLGSIKYVV